jgi:hypothetical protein
MNSTAESKPDFDMNKKEREVKGVYDLMINEGIDVPTAARYSVTTLPKARTSFVEWLSDGALTKVKGKIVEKGAA